VHTDLSLHTDIDTFFRASTGSFAMNRLSYGAAGLLLALSLTSMISQASCDECQFFGNATLKAFDHMDSRDVQGLSEADMKSFVVNAPIKFFNHTTFLTVNQTNALSCQQLKVYAHYIHTMLTKRTKRLMDHITGKGLGHKTVSDIQTELRDKLRNDFVDNWKGKNVSGIVLSSREDWDQVYEKIPDTAKYKQTGTSPGTVERLYDAFKVANLSEGVYEELKKSSADHLSSIAMEARLEAIRQSKTAAGEFFKNHQDEVEELYNRLHAHGALQMKEHVGGKNFRSVEAVHKCHHFCANCCDEQRVCTKDHCKEAAQPSSG